VAGIILYGLVLQFAGVWLVSDKLSYSIGLWFGIAVAVGMAVNIAVVIFDSVTLEPGKSANRRIIAKSVLRYVVVVVLFFIWAIFSWAI